MLLTVVGGLVLLAAVEAYRTWDRPLPSPGAPAHQLVPSGTQKVLARRARSIGQDILLAHRKPPVVGGIDLGSPTLRDEQLAEAARLRSSGPPGSGIPVPMAGEEATCSVGTGSKTSAWVECGSKSTEQGSPAGQVVKALVQPEEDPPVSVVDAGADDTSADGGSN